MQITKENLTIIIVTIKSEKIIDECIKSIPPEIKKIIIENSSNEEFVKNLKKNYKNLEGFVTKKNLGMGAGNNFGIDKSTSRYVMILNPDTILKKNTLELIFEVSKNLDFAILSPLCDDKDYPNYKIDKTKKEFIKEGLFEVDQVDGYAMVLDTFKFKKKFFDEKIFMYLENDDLCLRIKNKGEKIFVSNKSLITHLGAKAVNEIYFNEIELSRNWHWNWSKFYFRKKHYGFLNAFLFGFPVFIKSCFKCVIYLILNNKIKFKLYSFRALGFFNSLMNKESSHRPRLD